MPLIASLEFDRGSLRVCTLSAFRDGNKLMFEAVESGPYGICPALFSNEEFKQLLRLITERRYKSDGR